MDKVELIQPDFVSPELKETFDLLPKFFRTNVAKMRHYLRITNNSVKWFPSVTTVISKAVPDGDGLNMLRTQKGENFHSWMNELAHQGTFIHKEIGDYLRTEKFSWEFFETRVKAYLEKHNVTHYDLESWIYTLRPKIVALLRFIKEMKVTPLANEIVVSYEDREKGLCYAGAIDLIGYVNVREKGYHGEVYKSGTKKGEPKETYQEARKLMIIDFKSGTSFFKTYGMQLKMYKMALEQSTGLKVDGIMNVCPKEYKNGNQPNYNYKIWEDSEVKNVETYLELFFDEYKRPEKVAVFKGEMNGQDGIDSIFSYKEADEYVKDLSKVKQVQEINNQ